MKEMEMKPKAHALLLPYPGQGHVNPMMQFARRLVSKGLKTTFLTPVFICKAMGFASSVGPVQLEVISDGYDNDGFFENFDVEAYLTSLKAEGSRTLGELIVKYRSSANPVECVVYDPFLRWALDVAKDYGLLAAAFFTQPCAVDYIYYNIKNKLLTLPIMSTPVSIPGLPPLELRDTPSFIGVPKSYPAYFATVLSQFSNAEKADYILINTFYKLEAEVVDTTSKVCPVLTVGPKVPSMYLDKRIENDIEYNLDLYTLDASISMDWLSTKPPNSVVYVAFGSACDFSQKQMEEIAWGLKNTGFFFLWVINASEQEKFPKTAIEKLTDKGLVVTWSPQVKELATGTVGCFLTHSGWNSTIEALSLAVPMVEMPQWTDQPLNAKLVENVWKVGVRVKVDENGIVRRDEIESCVREVMESERGKEMKKDIEKWRELAIEAVSEGGSSDNNVDELISKLVTPSRSFLG